MPGTFTVFAPAYIEKFGLIDKGLELYKLCNENVQELPKKLTLLYSKYMKKGDS